MIIGKEVGGGRRGEIQGTIPANGAGHVARIGRGKMHIGYWWESQKERDHWEDQGVGGWTILKWISEEIGWDVMDWIDLAQDRDRWRALMNTTVNLRVP
jgi:hypothetical protein